MLSVLLTGNGFCRLVWGLVHSKKKTDVVNGSQLASVLMQSDELDDGAKKDLVFFQCVALYKLGKYVDAKRQLDEFLEVTVSQQHCQSASQVPEITSSNLCQAIICQCKCQKLPFHQEASTVLSADQAGSNKQYTILHAILLTISFQLQSANID